MARRPDVKRISAELFTLTYGSLIAQLLKDYETDEDVNKQLEKMGYNIGVRLIDDYLSHTTALNGRCQSFEETATAIAKDGFRMFLGIQPIVTNWSSDGKECSLLLDDNPLTTFVELPESHPGLFYSNLICGVIRGALEMVQMRVEVRFVKDVLRGDESTEIRMKLLEVMEESFKGDD